MWQKKKTQFLFTEDDIKAALQRRGPDSLGTKVVSLYSKSSYGEPQDCVLHSFIGKEGAAGNGCGHALHGELRLIGATLQLRGVNPVIQPLTDSFGNVLVFNGMVTEILVDIWCFTSRVFWYLWIVFPHSRCHIFSRLSFVASCDRSALCYCQEQSGINFDSYHCTNFTNAFHAFAALMFISW